MNDDKRGPGFVLVAIACVGLLVSGVVALFRTVDIPRGDSLGAAACLAVATLAFGVIFFGLLRR
jgi:heme/copper-type cytochrome/quinol oxidase subunit 3